MTRLRNIVLLGAVVTAACHEHEHEHGDHAHGHEAEHAHGAHEHAELPGQSVTVWSARTELFMEHPPLIAGKKTRFAAHVTALPSFKAVTEGAATITVRMSDGTTLTGRADGPSNPGIFRPEVSAEKPGKCEMRFSIAGAQLTDEFAVGPCEVYADDAQAIAALGDEEEAPGRITYLKEQQWKTEFATTEVVERELVPSVRANGEIKPGVGREARLVAPAAGRITLASPPPMIGAAITKNQTLASFTPRLAEGTDRGSLESEVAAARAELEAAEAQKSRAERLFAEQAIAERGVEEARTRVRVAKARVDAASSRLAQFSGGASGPAAGGGIQIRTPIEGTLVEAVNASGATVEEGAPLFTVIDLRRVWLEARVFESDIPKIENARFASFTVEGHETPFEINETNGRLITLGHVIDPKSRTVPIVFELDNPDLRLRIGQFAKVNIQAGARVKAIAVPESAIVDDAGKAIVFVHVEGESFERRPLTVGISDRGWVQIIEGVRPGERVVSKGAYEIKLASASGVIPAHGHAH
jgi:membrane fusion protein, heavy metal efflux system